MAFPSWRRWVNRRSKSSETRLHKARRPCIEALEDRVLLATRTWTGGSATDNNWTNPMNWDSGAPVPAVDDLLFPSGAAQLTNNNNFDPGTIFNKITFTGSGYSLTGSQVQLGGNGIADNVAGPNTISLDLVLPTTQGLQNFSVVASGNLNVSGVLTGGGGFTKLGPGTLVLSGTNTYAGVTAINQGVVSLRNNNALGAGDGTAASGTTVASGAALELQGGLNINLEALTLNGSGIQGAGALRSVGGVNSWAGPITLATDTTVADEANQLTLSGVVGGPGGLTVLTRDQTVTPRPELRLTAANSYSGNTVVTTGSTLTLREQGSIVNSLNVSVLGGTLNLDSLGDRGRPDFNSNTRLRSNANVTLNAAVFTLKGNDIVDTNQVIGPINLVGGASRIISTPGGGPRVATLTSSRLNRSRGATVSFEGPVLGSFTNKILFTTAPNLVGGILPFATWFDPAGFLNPATYTPDFGITPVALTPNRFVPGGNIVITQSFISVPDPGVTINSLFVIGDSITIAGAQLTISSGMVLFAKNMNNANRLVLNIPILDFGSVEGIVLTLGSPAFPNTLATINSRIAGLNGLTKSGTGELEMGFIDASSSNTYLGATILSAGRLVLNKEPRVVDMAGQTQTLVSIPGPFTIGDGVSIAGAQVVQLSKPDQIAPNAPVTVTSSGLLTTRFSNQIGALTVLGGGVQIGPGIDAMHPAVFTIAGTLTMTGGRISSTDPAMLVLGGNVMINPSRTPAVIAGSLSLGTTAVGGPTRTFTVAADLAAPSLDIQATISGDAGVGLVKNGPGTIRFSSTTSNSYAGSTSVAAGTLQLNMPGAIAVSGPLIVGGAVGAANSAILRLLTDGQLATAVAVTVNSSGLFDLNNKNNTVASLSMAGGNVTTGTGTLTLTGDVSGGSPSSTATIAGNLALGTGTFALASGATMTIPALITGSTGLTKTGPGSLELSANNTYTGTTTVTGGTLVIGGTAASNTYVVNSGGTLIMNATQLGNNFTVNNGGTLVVNGSQLGGTVSVTNGGTLRGTGSVGDVAVANGGAVNTGSPLASTGILTSAGNVILNGTFVAQLNGTTAGSTYNQLVITSGTVNLTGSILVATLNFATSTNDTFVLLRKPSAGNIVGTFAGLGEGAGFTIGNRQFRITYAGGSGNDVVLTTQTSATATAITSAPNPTTLGQPVTFTATVTAVSEVGTPTGTVTFKDGSTVLGSVPLSGNQASLVISTLTPGSHAVVATYNGDGSYDASTAGAPANQQVLPPPTTSITVVSNLSLPNFGQTITFTAMVRVETGTGTPTGTVIFSDRGTTLGTASLGSDGKATLSISTLSLGLHSITAVYGGDTVFVGSTSQPLAQIVGTPPEIFIGQVYQDLLRRPADPAGVANWNAVLAGGHTRAEIARAIAGSPERHTLVVRDLYVTYLHRDADLIGLATFVTFLNTGGTVSQLRVILTGSQEYFEHRGGSDLGGFLEALYGDALNRAADAAGRQLLLFALGAGATRGQVANAIFASDEFRQVLVQNLYLQFLHRPADNGGRNFFALALRAGARDEDVIAALLGSEEYLRRA